jgi:hypothetical protein
VSAGGSDFVERLSSSEELRLLAGGERNIWGQDPSVLLEAAECGVLDCLREDG